MKSRDVAALALLLVAVGLESTGFFATSMLMPVALHERGQSALALGMVMTLGHGLTVAGMLTGGAAALGIGPRFTAAVGALLGAAGYLVMAAGGPLEAGFCLASFGVGMLRPCPVVAAAAVLAWDDRTTAPPAPHRFALVGAFAAALLCAGNAGGFAGSLFGGALGSRSGYAAVHGAAGALTLLAAALFAVAGLLGVRWTRAAEPAPLAGPYREPSAAPDTTRPADPPALGGLAKLLAVQAVYVLAASLTTPPPSLFASTSTSEMGRLYALMPTATLVGCVGTLAVLLVAGLQRWTAPPLLLQGAALVVVAAGLVPLAASGSSVALYGLGAVVTGLAAAAATVVPLAYAAITVRGRAATLVVAVWSAIGGVVSSVGTFAVSLGEIRGPLLGLCALLCLGAGAALLRFGRALHRDFEPAAG